MTPSERRSSVAIDYRAHGSIAILMLDRPETLNALNEALLDEFDSALDSVEADDSVRGAVVVGAGRAFCAGNDLKEVGVDGLSRVRRMHSLVLRLTDLTKPVAAAMNGLALGGGLELAMSCTFRIAVEEARLGLPEAKMDLMPGFGGTQLLPRLIGASRALDMLMSGEPVDAATALRIGLVDRVTAGNPIDAAVDLLSRYSDASGSTLRAIRTAVRAGSGLPLRQALEVEYKLVAEVSSSGVGSRAAQEFQTGKRFM